jgi:hypothetical protein
MWFNGKIDYLEQKVAQLELRIRCLEGKHTWGIPDGSAYPCIFCTSCYKMYEKQERKEKE